MRRTRSSPPADRAGGLYAVVLSLDVVLRSGRWRAAMLSTTRAIGEGAARHSRRILSFVMPFAFPSRTARAPLLLGALLIPPMLGCAQAVAASAPAAAPTSAPSPA